MTEILVDSHNRLLIAAGKSVACAVGRNGVCALSDKREGDGRTPCGIFPLRQVFARRDRLAPIVTDLPWRWLDPMDGWCDSPLDPQYNQWVRHPYPASAEYLWRTDGLYDIIVVIGHNDQPVSPGLGSAIFLHCALRQESGELRPTEGCVAIGRDDLLSLLPCLNSDCHICIR